MRETQTWSLMTSPTGGLEVCSFTLNQLMLPEQELIIYGLAISRDCRAVWLWYHRVYNGQLCTYIEQMIACILFHISPRGVEPILLC